MLVVDGGVHAKDVAIAPTVNVVAGIAIRVFVFAKPEGESALKIFLLHPSSRERNTEKSSQEPTELVGGIGATDMASWTSSLCIMKTVFIVGVRPATAHVPTPHYLMKQAM